MIETKIILTKEVKVELLHQELLAEFPDFKGMQIINGVSCILVSDKPLNMVRVAEIIEAHDMAVETTDETTERLREEDIAAAEVIIAASADPMEVLTAKVARLEALLGVK